MAQEIKPEGARGMRTALTVLKPRDEVYRFWRDFENLAVMEHVESVTVIGDRRTHWVVQGTDPAHRAEWDSEVTRDEENELLEWRTLEGSDFPNGGSVAFMDAPGGRGTEVYVEMWFDVPGGALGSAYLKLRKEHPLQLVREDIRRLKHVLETGEVPTIEGQPTGHEESGLFSPNEEAPGEGPGHTKAGGDLP